MKEYEKGAALAIGLILLVPMTITSALILNMSVQDERMSLNHKTQTDAFLMAEKGYYEAKSNFNDDDEWDATWSDFFGESNTCTNGASIVSDTDGNLQYSVVVDACNVNGNNQHRLRSIGRNVSAETKREILFVVEGLLSGSTPRGGGLGGAINFFGDISGFDAPNSNSFVVDGNGGTSIGASSSEDADLIIADIEGKGREANYYGNIEEINYSSPWNNASDLQTFINDIEKTAQSGGANRYFNGNHNAGNAKTYVNGVTVVNGNMSVGGNFEGSGVLVVKGDFSTSGTPKWDGVIVVLGGTFSIGGGGSGGVTGSIYVADVDTGSSSWEFNNNALTFTNGGGNATYAYDCNELYTARSYLSETAKNMWSMDSSCNSTGGGGGGGGGGGEDNVAILNWKEDIADN